MLSSTAALGAAQGIQVNGPLPAGIAGDVTLFRISPDSSRVVYLADQDEDGAFGLYSVPLGGGPVVKLDPRVGTQGESLDYYHAFEITPDSRTVVYQRGNGPYELFSVPILGSQPPTPLSGSFPGPGEGVVTFALSSDGRRVVYRAEDVWDGPTELFSVPVGGGTRVKLSAPLVAGGNVTAFRISADGRRVVYRADQETYRAFELYGVDIEGGPAVELNAPLAPGEGVDGDFAIAPDSKRVLYRTGFLSTVASRLLVAPILGGPSLELSGGAVEFFQVTRDAEQVVFVRDGGLLVVRTSGGAALPLSGPLPAHEHVDEFVIAPDSKRVVYHVEFGDGPEGEVPVALYSVSLAGGPAVELARPRDLYVANPLVSPDSRRVVYHRFNYSGVEELWSAPIAGGPGFRLLDQLPEFAEFDPASNRLVYVAGDYDPSTTPTYLEVFSIPATGGTPTRLNGPMVEQGWVLARPGPQLSRDGTRVVYVADQEHDEALELFSVPLAGGPATQLNPELARGRTAGDVEESLVSPDGTHVLYRADQDEDDVFELYGAALPRGAGTPAEPVKLNGPLVRNGDVARFLFRASPDSQRAVFVADAEVVGIGELYSVPLDGGLPIKLNAERGAGIGIHGFDLSPDSTRVVFLDDPDEPRRPELFSVPLEGGPVVELSAAILDLDFVGSAAISADSSRVVFTALHGDEAALELYGIPIDGGPLTRLSPTPVSGGRVFTFQILPDASAVVYSGDLERDDVVELFLVPIDGGATVRLSGASIIRLGDVSAFALSPDSRYAVYRADQEINEVVELHSVSLADGVRTKLSGPLVSGGDVTSFRIAPDSSRVVYVADAITNDVLELFSVPLAGGGATRLNPPLTVNGDVDDFLDSYQISPASDRVVYLADQERNGWVELYSVPLTGGAAVKLNAPLVFGNGGAVQRGFAITADARQVVYRTNQANNQLFELFVAPIAGEAPPRRLNRTQEAFRNVTPALDSPRAFQLAGNHVLYRAEQDDWEVFQLYLSHLAWDDQITLPRRRR